jgi:hypothetical protein
MPFDATPALSRPAESATRGSVVDGNCAEAVAGIAASANPAPRTANALIRIPTPPPLGLTKPSRRTITQEDG